MGLVKIETGRALDSDIAKSKCCVVNLGVLREPYLNPAGSIVRDFIVDIEGDDILGTGSTDVFGIHINGGLRDISYCRGRYQKTGEHA
jgi:hypothetical protein